MRRVVTLGLAMIGLFGSQSWAATSVFSPRPPPGAAPDVTTANETAFRDFLAAHCKIQEAMGKGSGAEANVLIKEASDDLDRSNSGFGVVVKSKNAETPLHVPDTAESRDALAAISRQDYPVPNNFASLFSTLQRSVAGEIKALREVKFTDNEESNLRTAIYVNNNRVRTEAIYVSVSVLTTLAKR
jgi:hypothetical protein